MENPPGNLPILGAFLGVIRFIALIDFTLNPIK